MRYLLLLGIACLTVGSFIVPDAKSFMEPSLARMIFFHLPCAIGTTVFVYYGAYASAKFLKTREAIWDTRSLASNEVGMLFCVLTMITGILFSKVQWGAWWQWDPRQTSFLMVMLVYGAYFTVRGAFSDEQRKMSAAASYWVTALLPITFLIFVFPRLPQVTSFHPSNTVVTGGFDRSYSIIIIGLLLTLIPLGFWVCSLRVRLGVLVAAVERLDADSSAPPTARVTPVAATRES